jgi:hypothetical protein
MAAGHQASDPTRKRGSIGVTLHSISRRRPNLSHDRTFLSCREWNNTLGRVLSLPPLRFGLQVRDDPALTDRATSPEEQRPELQRARRMTGMRLPQYNPKPYEAATVDR